MSEVEKIEQLRHLAASLADGQVLTQVENAVSALEHSDKVRILTATINNLRKSKHVEVAALLGEVAYARYPNNSFLLAALTTSLVHARRSQEVVTLIEEFFSRIPAGKLSENDVVHLTINLSSGYKGLGRITDAIHVLVQLEKKPENVTRTLIELYCNAGAYDKAIELAQQQPHLNFVSAKWYAKALYSSGRPNEAMEVTEAFKDVPDIKKLRSEFLSNPNLVSIAASANPNNKIFIVHGHDDSAREQLELMLHRLGLNPFVLLNTSGGGLTIIEALEKEISQHPEAARFGVVLLTPDDVGYPLRDGPSAARPRARQNVVLEMGMLLAELGKENVAILRKGEVEEPSDIRGIIYLSFKEHVREIASRLVERLRTSGFDIEPARIVSASA